MNQPKKIDQRKTNSAATRAKKASAGKKRATGLVLVPSKSIQDHLQERIEMVVLKAEQDRADGKLENADDVVRHNRFPVNGKGRKLG